MSQRLIVPKLGVIEFGALVLGVPGVSYYDGMSNVTWRSSETLHFGLGKSFLMLLT